MRFELAPTDLGELVVHISSHFTFSDITLELEIGHSGSIFKTEIDKILKSRLLII